MTSRPANGYEVQRAGKHTLVKLADRDSGFGVGWPVNWLVEILVGSKHLGGLPLAADEVDCILCFFGCTWPSTATDIVYFRQAKAT